MTGHGRHRRLERAGAASEPGMPALLEPSDSTRPIDGRVASASGPPTRSSNWRPWLPRGATGAPFRGERLNSLTATGRRDVSCGAVEAERSRQWGGPPPSGGLHDEVGDPLPDQNG